MATRPVYSEQEIDVTDEMPRFRPMTPFTEELIILSDFGPNVMSVDREGGALASSHSTTATLLDYHGKAVAWIVEPDERRDGSPQWEGREEPFRRAVRAWGRGYNGKNPPPSAVAYIVFDQGRENEQRELAE